MLSANARRTLKRLRDDPEYYVGKLLHIKTKSGEVVPFRLWEEQAKYLKDLVSRYDAGEPIRDIILKSRQLGFSTLIEAVLFHRVVTSRNRRARIIAHDLESADNLFNITKLYYDTLPAEMKPMKRYSNKKELVFENPDEAAREKNAGLRSAIHVGSADKTTLGRSETIHFIHLSEFAFYRDAATLMTGLTQAVPYLPGTIVIIETTANGIGNYFYELWQASVRGETVWKTHFFPWFNHSEYRMKTPAEKPNAEERRLVKAHGLDLNQIAWRRMKQKELGDQFQQEYPETDFDAFLSSGRPVFPVDILRGWLKGLEAKPPKKWIGRLVDSEEEISFEEGDGPLTVWEWPKSTGQYVVSTDSAEGLPDGDNAVIEVYNKRSLSQCAEYCAKIDPDLLGEEAYVLSQYFNNAPIIPEANNHGLTTINVLKKRTQNIYARKVFDQRLQKDTTRLGFLTSAKTKPLLIDHLKKLIREESIVIRSKALLMELLAFVQHEDGTMGAQEGAHDDRVMGTMLAAHMIKERPYREKKARRPSPPRKRSSVTGYA